MTDTDIIDKILTGDKDSFAELVRLHHPRVIGLCLSLLRNKQEAEDAAQDSFLKAYKALSTFRRGAQFSTWLYQIAYNHCLDLLRKRTREKLQSWDALLEERGEQVQNLLKMPGDLALSFEQTDLVKQILASLPEDHRNVLILREINGFSYEEIAEFLHCSLDAVKGRLKRARADLEEKCRHLLSPTDV